MRVAAIPGFLKANITQTHNDYVKKDFQSIQKVNENDCFTKSNHEISFTGPAQSKMLLALRDEKIPCMYCGKLMIKSEVLMKMKSSGALNGPAKKVLPIIEKYKDCLLSGTEETFSILKKLAYKKPNADLQELLSPILNKYEKKLVKKQLPVLQDMKQSGKELPENFKKVFDELMQLSYFEIFNHFENMAFKREKFITRLNDGIIEPLRCKDLINNQINKNKIPADIWKHINDKEYINNLYENGTIRTRAYNLLNRARLANELSVKAEKLPRPDNSAAAFICEYSKLPSKEIAYNLLHPSMYTVEHLVPRSTDPASTSKIGNYLFAHGSENNRFKDTPLSFRISVMPEIVKNSKKQLRTLRKFANQGRLRPEDVVETTVNLKEISNGKIDTNLSLLDMKAYEKRVQREINLKKRLGLKIKQYYEAVQSGKGNMRPITVPKYVLTGIKSDKSSYDKVILTKNQCILCKDSSCAS